MDLGFPWAWLLLPLPLLARWLLRPAVPLQSTALRFPFGGTSDGIRAGPALARLDGRTLAGWLVWLLLVAAASDPLQPGPAEETATTGRDLMFVVDVSGSMGTADFGTETAPRTRLDTVKEVAAAFLSRRSGDRVGTILFGDAPFLLVPLTYDRAALTHALDTADVQLGGDSTTLGDAIGLAVGYFAKLDAGRRAMVVLTDGGHNAGRLSPRQAADLARRYGVRLYTIAVGAERSAMPDPRQAWSAASGESYSEATLRELARVTGGRYFTALDRTGLEQAHGRIDELEPSLGPDARRATARRLYPWPLAAALGLSLAIVVLQLRRWGGAP